VKVTCVFAFIRYIVAYYIFINLGLLNIDYIIVKNNIIIKECNYNIIIKSYIILK
jgi:hypothetical protein